MPKKMDKAKPLTEQPKKEKPSAYQRGYDKTHTKLRKELLATFPICQRCNKDFSTDAHHLKYPANSIEDYLAVCQRCHRAIEHEHRNGT